MLKGETCHFLHPIQREEELAMGAKRFTASKNDKEWCAERSGELRLDDPDMRKIFRTQLIDELLDKHGLPHIRKNRQKNRKCIPNLYPRV